MKKIIPIMVLLLFVGICFTAQSENQTNNESNIPSQTISGVNEPVTISELRHTKKSSDHIIYTLSNNNQFFWSYDPITYTDNIERVYKKPTFLEDLKTFFQTIARYTVFLALGLGFIVCFVSIWGIPLIALREFYRFIKRRLKMVRT